MHACWLLLGDATHGTGRGRVLRWRCDSKAGVPTGPKVIPVKPQPFLGLRTWCGLHAFLERRRPLALSRTHAAPCRKPFHQQSFLEDPSPDHIAVCESSHNTALSWGTEVGKTNTCTAERHSHPHSDKKMECAKDSEPQQLNTWKQVTQKCEMCPPSERKVYEKQELGWFLLFVTARPRPSVCASQSPPRTPQWKILSTHRAIPMGNTEKL